MCLCAGTHPGQCTTLLHVHAANNGYMYVFTPAGFDCFKMCLCAIMNHA